MTQSVNVPGVGLLQFPDGMSQSDMAAAIQKHFPEIHTPSRLSPSALSAKLKADYAAANTPEKREAAYQKAQDAQVSEMSGFQKLAAGAGKAVYDTGRGIGQLVGLESKQDVQQARSQDAALMRTGSGKVGNVAGYVMEAVPAAMTLPAMGVGIPAAVGGRMAVGGVSGGAQGYAAPYTSTREHVMNTLAGGVLGSALPGLGSAAGAIGSRMITPEAKALMQAGVELTPGQKLGGLAKTAEDKLTSFPLVGGAIRNAQQRSIDSFSRTAVNRVLTPLGLDLPKSVKTGHEALIYAQNKVSKTYDDALQNMSGSVDGTFRKGVGDIWNKYASTLGKKGDELQSFIVDGVLSKMEKTGATTGKIIHDIQSDLGQQASRLLKSELQSDRTLGNAVKELQSHVKGLLTRQNPSSAITQYRAATDAYRNLVRVQKAASLVGSKDGVITPNTLRQAVRATDSTRNKMAYSQGRAEMQDLAEHGMEVIPSKVPDSGTAGRLLGAGLIGSGAVTGHALPILAAGALAHGMYSRPGQALIAHALQPRSNPVTNYLTQLAARRFAQSQPASPPPQMPVPQQ